MEAFFCGIVAQKRWHMEALGVSRNSFRDRMCRGVAVSEVVTHRNFPSRRPELKTLTSAELNSLMSFRPKSEP